MKKIVVLLLLMVSANVFAEWTFIGNDVEGTSAYVDLSSIRKKGRTVKMWDLMDYQMVKGIVGQGNIFGEDRSNSYLSSIVFSLYDCEEETRSVINGISYSGQMGSGTIIAESFPDGARREPVMPGTVSEKLFKIACGKK